MNPTTTIKSPHWPSATFRLWTGWQSDQAVLEELGPRKTLCRWPHHTASVHGMMGSIRIDNLLPADPHAFVLQPGEIQISSILVLQDLPEFRRHTIETVADAWHNGWQTLTIGKTKIRIPVHCSILATAQACPCGYCDVAERKCVCTDQILSRWQARIDDAVKLFRGGRECAHDWFEGTYNGGLDYRECKECGEVEVEQP